MEKTLKRLLCIVMALTAVVVFAACNTEEKPEEKETEQTTQEVTQEETQEETTLPVEQAQFLVGKWEGQIDMADYFSDRIYENSRVDVVFDPCMVVVKVTFDEDGTYKGRIKPDFSESFQNLDEEFVTTIIEMAAESAGMSVAQYERALKAEGYSKEDYVKTFAEAIEAMLYEEVKAYEEELVGKWSLEGDELYLDPNNPSRADPYIIKLDGDTLTVTEITDDDDGIGDYFLPLVFTRA